MLIIEESTKAHFAEVIIASVENGSFMSLVEQLNRLNKTRGSVTLGRAFMGARKEFAVTWYGDSENPQPFMHGGLVYHSSDNTWGTHT